MSGSSRREFCVTAACVAGLAWGASRPLTRLLLQPRNRSPQRAALEGFFSDRESARAVGRVYLEATPAEASLATLLERLDCEALSRDPGDARAELRARHRRDFREGRTVTLDGWLLSRTEARLCAVAALG